MKAIVVGTDPGHPDDWKIPEGLRRSELLMPHPN
jgi:hypothetical protein